MTEPAEGRPSVLHVLWGGDVGGVERLVSDLADAQSAHGVVGVALARSHGALVGELSARGLPVVDLGLGSGYDVRVGRVARAATKIRGWDVIHLHGFNVPLALVAIRAGRPIVFTDHGSAPRGGRRLMPDMVKRGLLALFLRRYVDAVTANSRYTAARTSKLYGVPRNEMTVVYNGVTMEALGPAGSVASDEGLVVAFLGRLVKFKRVDRLLEAAANIPPEQKVRFVVIGDGPLERQLRSLAHQLSLDDRVSFLGVRHDAASLLKSADILVQPSHGEPFGLAIVEACALGLLPITFADGGGALEVLPPDGRVVEDSDHLARTLQKLVGSAELSAEARRARSEWALKTFPIAKTAQGYEAVYRMALRMQAPRDAMSR